MRYWPEKGKSGFLVWRYLLRRDDSEPGPWTKEGKDRIKKLGLTMQVRLTQYSCLEPCLPGWALGIVAGAATGKPGL